MREPSVNMDLSKKLSDDNPQDACDRQVQNNGKSMSALNCVPH